MIFRISTLDSALASATLATATLVATSMVVTAKAGDATFEGSPSTVNGDIDGLHILKLIEDRHDVAVNDNLHKVDQEGTEKSLHLESRFKDKTTIGTNRQLRNTKKTSDAPLSDGDEIVDLGILSNPVPADSKDGLGLEIPSDHTVYCETLCGSNRTKIDDGANMRHLVNYCPGTGKCGDCSGDADDIDYRCASEINCWDTSDVTDMTEVFYFMTSFNEPLTCWDVSSVTSMSKMFSYAHRFNQTIDDWDVSSVTDMDNMFYEASDFNQPLSKWNTSSVENMMGMFDTALQFNQPLNSWNTSSVETMYGMFMRAKVFNQDLDSWDVSSVTAMQSMFSDANIFNGNIQSWDVSSVKNMYKMFSLAYGFDQAIGNWDVSSVRFMTNMFGNDSGKTTPFKFNQFIGNWNVSSVRSMALLFAGNDAFNQPLESWDVSSAVFMNSAFSGASSFNQPLDVWDVSPDTTMPGMFDGAYSFNQCLSTWATKTYADDFEDRERKPLALEDMFRATSCRNQNDPDPEIKNAPWCQDSNDQCVGVTCVDDPDFLTEDQDSNFCEWVASKTTKERCAQEGVTERCSKTCNPVCIGGCFDDQKFRLNGVKAKSCQWVAKQKTEERCKKPGVMAACRQTCNPICSRENVCIDDQDFRLGGVKAKSCEWVAKQKTDERCKKPGVMASCRRTCDPSCGCRDSDEEFDFQGSMITCKDLDIIHCDAEPTIPDEFSWSLFESLLDEALAPIHERLDAIEDAIVEGESALEVDIVEPIHEHPKTYADLCPNKCKKCA